MIGGLLYVVLGVIMLVSPPVDPRVLSSASDYLGEGLLIAALLLTLGGLVALRLRQAGSYGVPGKAGFYTAAVGQVALLVSAAASFATGEDVLGPVFVLGFLLWLIGLVVLAFATFRAAILPRWSAAVLAVGLLLSVPVFERGGTIVLGLAWIALGYVLWSRREAPTERPSRVR